MVTPTTETSAATPDAVEPAGEAPEPVSARDPDPVLVALGSDYASADLDNGRRQFRRCQACHTLAEGARHSVGPNLYGIIDAPAASQEGFAYSDALEQAGLVWTAETMDAWIENPRVAVPGNRMSFVGLRDAEARRDLIAYLAVETAP
ncbi:c-type cytochrome [Maricaulis sp. CAU 1757]